MRGESFRNATFTCLFANTEQDLARYIPPVHTVRESYLISTQLLTMISIRLFPSKVVTLAIEVRKLLERVETKKVTDVNNWPPQMFKDVFNYLNWMVKWRQVFWHRPQLAFFFNLPISCGIVPAEWKLPARVAQFSIRANNKA